MSVQHHEIDSLAEFDLGPPPSRDQLPAILRRLACVQAALADCVDRELTAPGAAPVPQPAAAAVPRPAPGSSISLEPRQVFLVLTLRNLVVLIGEWQGTATELLATLSGLLLEDEAGLFGWPGHGRSLSLEIRQLVPVLRHLGIRVGSRRAHGGQRIIVLSRIGSGTRPHVPQLSKPQSAPVVATNQSPAHPFHGGANPEDVPYVSGGAGDEPPPWFWPNDPPDERRRWWKRRIVEDEANPPEVEPCEDWSSSYMHRHPDDPLPSITGDCEDESTSVEPPAGISPVDDPDA